MALPKIPLVSFSFLGRPLLDTKHKISIARLLSLAVIAIRRLFSLPDVVTVKRRGITWSLNLREGIDFAIYLLGGFEVRAMKRCAQFITKGGVALDIGANIGAHTLPLAELVGKGGKVIAFEPTIYALQKLRANIALNPNLASRIDTRQVMLMKSKSDMLPPAVYSSWPLETAADLHKEHLGRLMITRGASVTTLDHAVIDAGLSKVDFIKLDVDGNEYKVLGGGIITMRRFKPIVMMELAPYVYSCNPAEFDQTISILYQLGYEIFDIANMKPLPRDVHRLKRLIPISGGLNVLAKIT